MKTEEISSQNSLPEENIEEMEMCSNPNFGEFDPDEFEVLDEVGEEDENHVESKQCNILDTSSNLNQDSLFLSENSKPCLDQDELISQKIKLAANNENLKKINTSDMKWSQQICKVELKDEAKAESPVKSSVTTELKIETNKKNNCNVIIGKVLYVYT